MVWIWNLPDAIILVRADSAACGVRENFINGRLDQLGTIGGFEPLEGLAAFGLGLEVVLGLLLPMGRTELATGFAAHGAAISESAAAGVPSLATDGEEGELIVDECGHGMKENRDIGVRQPKF